MEERQRLKLTDTNHSIELDPYQKAGDGFCKKPNRLSLLRQTKEPKPVRSVACNAERAGKQMFPFIYYSVSGWPGGHSECEPPDPIPNSAVKPLSVDGTLA